MYSLPDGAYSNDGDLCQGGWVDQKKCHTAVEVKGGVYREDVSYPYKCDLNRFSTCTVIFADKGWKEIGSCQCSLD